MSHRTWIAGIVRIDKLGIIKEKDVIHSLAVPALWTTVEPGVGIIGNCLPCLWPLVKKMKIFRSTTTTTKSSNYVELE